MNKKSKKTLKNAFNIPEPNRKEQFFNSLETKPEKRFFPSIPLYLSTAVTALIVLGVWGGIKNLPYFQPPETTDTQIYSVSTSMTNNTENNIIITTTALSSSGSDIVQTTAVTEISYKKSVQTTATSGTATKETQTQNTTLTSRRTTGTQTTDVTTSGNQNKPPDETEENNSLPETTRSTAVTARTSATHKTTVATTTATQIKTTASLLYPQIATQTTTKFQNYTPPNTTTPHSEDEAQIVTTTTENNGTAPPSVDVPKPTENDFTVTPTVQYYPSGDAIDIRTLLSNDSIFPPEFDPSLTNSVQNIESIIKDSDLIVLATVNKVIYTGIDSKPYTQENITVLNAIYGFIPEGAKISVYSKGGYIPASEYSPDMSIDLEEAIENNSTLFDPSLNNSTPCENNIYLYLLNTNDGDFPDGSYSLTTLSDVSKFRYENGNYINVNNNNLVLSSEELHDYIYN
ncbi:MAG: hypothetical protein NC177_04055 [Ruminococcus flavefaciens]|nr:hypothetical protein [Ruminococcus flavefaciens]